MAGELRRVVDAHVHHWDPTRVNWYPFLASEDALRDLGMENVTAMRRPFDHAIYMAESAKWHVDKYVHVTAAVGELNFLEETAERERDAQRDGHPDAIIGGIDPHGPVAEMERQLDRQQEAAHFRGVRVSEGMDHQAASSRALLSSLASRGLVYDLVVHPGDMLAAARVLADFPSLTVVVEHTGWPLSEGADHVRLWREGMVALANAGDNVHCKISGLAMTLNRIDPASLRPWTDHCLSAFGVGRCFFASNFPVDGLFGSFDDLYSAYDAVTQDLSDQERARLFASNAEAVYGC